MMAFNFHWMERALRTLMKSYDLKLNYELLETIADSFAGVIRIAIFRI